MDVSLDQACTLLKAGKVIAVPTETVYGLAAALHSQEAITTIFAIKGRPQNNPLIVHLASANELITYAKELPNDCLKLAEAFWPGPLTIVLKAHCELIPDIARAHLPTAAFRVPNHPLARDLIERVGPLVMPSANLSGRPSSTSPDHVETDFGKHFPILNGGECHSGVESTILIWDNGKWIIIRLGALAPEDFFPVLGYLPEVVIEHKHTQEAPLCPGQLFRHYAPKASLKLVNDFSQVKTGIILGFSDRTYPSHCRLIPLGTIADPHTVAHRLYAALRMLDEQKIDNALVDIDLPNEGLWLTLKERLSKAARDDML